MVGGVSTIVSFSSSESSQGAQHACRHNRPSARGLHSSTQCGGGRLRIGGAPAWAHCARSIHGFRGRARRSTLPQLSGSRMSSGRNISANRCAGMKGSCGLRNDAIRKNGCLPPCSKEPHDSRATKLSKWSASGDLRYAADGDRALRGRPDSARPFPRIAGIAPQIVDLRQTRARVGAAQFIGVELGLRTQVLIPFVEVELVIEAVRLRIHKVHLADRARSCSPRAPKW